MISVLYLSGKDVTDKQIRSIMKNEGGEELQCSLRLVSSGQMNKGLVISSYNSDALLCLICVHQRTLLKISLFGFWIKFDKIETFLLQALFPPGVITYDRLVELAGEIKSISSDDIMRAFKTFDLNGDNFISLTELRVLLQKVILEQLSRLRK